MSLSKKMKIEGSESQLYASQSNGRNSTLMKRINRAHRPTDETRKVLTALMKNRESERKVGPASTRRLLLDRLQAAFRGDKLGTLAKTKNNYLESENELAHEHAVQILNGLKSMTASNSLTDVVLIVGGQRFPCHKCVLSLCSPYFKTMFETELDVSRQEEVEIKEVSEVAMSAIVDYAYTQKIRLRKENVEEIFTASHLLQVKGLQTLSKHFLGKYANYSDCVNVFRLASLYDLPDLKKICLTLISQQFLELSITSDFLEMNSEQIEEIIKSDDLYVSSEKQVLDVLLKWTEHDVENRKASLPMLLKNVRLSLLPSLEELKKIPLLLVTEGCLKLIEETELKSDVQQSPVGEKRGAYSRSKLRRGMYYPFMMAYPTVYYQTPAKKEPSEGRMLSAQTLVVTEQDEIFVVDGHYIRVGGDDVAVDFNFHYQKSTKSWVECAPLQEKRYGCLCAAVSGFIYAIGGYRMNNSSFDNIPVQSVERYEIAKDRWEYVDPLPFRLGSKSRVISNNGNVYLINGLNMMSTLKHPSKNWSSILNPAPPHMDHVVALSVRTYETILYCVVTCFDSETEANDAIFQKRGKLVTLAFDGNQWKLLCSSKLSEFVCFLYDKIVPTDFKNGRIGLTQEAVVCHGNLYLFQCVTQEYYLDDDGYYKECESVTKLFKYLPDEKCWIREHEFDSQYIGENEEFQFLYSKFIPLHQVLHTTVNENYAIAKEKNSDSEGSSNNE